MTWLLSDVTPASAEQIGQQHGLSWLSVERPVQRRLWLWPAVGELSVYEMKEEEERVPGRREG